MKRQYPLRGKHFWFALLVLCGTFTLPAGAAAPEEYGQALGRVQSAISDYAQAIGADQVPSGEAPSLVAERTLGPIHSVDGPQHVPVLVNLSPLIAAIQAAEAVKAPKDKVSALEAVSAQIAVLREELAFRRSDYDPAQITRSARTVLSGSEFASEPPPPPSLAEKVAAWLDKVFTWHQPAGPNVNMPSINPRVILGIFYLIGAGALAVLVAIIVQAIGRRGARVRPLALDEEEAVLVEARDNDSLLALAEQQAKAGDYRRAFRLVYLAALVALDTGGVLRFDRSKTNWEYLRALRAAGRSDIYAALTPLTREFDQVWYGFAATDAGHYSRALAQYQALLAGSKGTATGAGSVRETVGA